MDAKQVEQTCPHCGGSLGVYTVFTLPASLPATLPSAAAQTWTAPIGTAVLTPTPTAAPGGNLEP